MSLRFYNTLTNRKEIFEPHQPGKVGMYLCGPTVYKPSHIGHAVGPVIFDVLKRYLTFKGFEVRWVVNITDVDDKLIHEAAAQNTTVPELARRIEALYLGGMRQLGIRGIDHLPRAGDHIPEIIASIQKLIDGGFAYAAQGSVYFDVARDEHYGKLSNRKPDELLAGTRDDLVEAGKRSAADFAMWKAAKPGEPKEVTYDSPWGPGRPGWHIECSAMSMKYLGETFDIHGGGMDLIFPHHENEIAQSECMNGRPFARVWLHNGLTRFNTKKIAKSDASLQQVMSQLALTHLLETHGPELLRYVIISSHYRSPLDFSEETIAAARKGLQTFYRLFERIERCTGRSAYESSTRIEQVRGSATQGGAAHFVEQILGHQLAFLAAMDDDLNTAGAIGVLYEAANSINRFIEAEQIEVKPGDDGRKLAEAATGTLLFMARLLGLFETPPPKAGADDGLAGSLVELLIEARRMAREAKQYALGDHIRAKLSELGIVLEDRAGGTNWRRE